jgi:hypothetical protein
LRGAEYSFLLVKLADSSLVSLEIPAAKCGKRERLIKFELSTLHWSTVDSVSA